MIGSLGDIAFETSSDLVRTFTGFTQRKGARWAEHTVIGRAPVMEFAGRSLREISIQITLSVARGVVPLEELERITAYVEDGDILPLVIGSERLGDFVITEAQEARTVIGNRGELVSATLSLTLKEYVDYDR